MSEVQLWCPNLGHVTIIFILQSGADTKLWTDFAKTGDFVMIEPKVLNKMIWGKYVTAEMDISAGFVPAGPNLTGGMDPGMNTNIQTEYMKSKHVRFSLRNILFIYSFFF